MNGSALEALTSRGFTPQQTARGFAMRLDAGDHCALFTDRTGCTLPTFDDWALEIWRAGHDDEADTDLQHNDEGATFADALATAEARLTELTDEERPDVPADWEVQPIEFMSAEYHAARHDGALAQCGTCSRMWNDAEPTGMTPAPSGRCPFEPFH